jgi:hypothetical protein
VDVKDKIMKALWDNLETPYIRLEEDDGISGFVVSPRFEGMPMLDRQAVIDDAISKGPIPLSPEEKRHILMIAGLTPAESDAVGAGIRVQTLREKPNGSIEVLLHGGLSDAEYVRGALKALKGVRTTKPKQSAGPYGTLMLFRAEGTPADPLTKERAIQALKDDPYIDLMPGA